MKDLLNSMNKEALCRLVPVVSTTMYDNAMLWKISQVFYAEDGSFVEFIDLGKDAFQITFNTQEIRMSYSISKVEYLALKTICERNTNKVYNYCK